jgi:NurA-like 5'-3' nuclease
MAINNNSVSVFKTSVKTKKNIKKISPFLNRLTEIKKWNFDLQDTDNILRIESDKELARDVQDLLKGKGFYCEELN